MRILGLRGERRGSTSGRLLACIAVLVALLLPATEAFAARKICRQLEAQLASLSSGGGRATSQSRKYDGAIARQRQQLAIARGRASDLGCGFAVFGRNVRQCASLNATISRMQSNLGTLERTRGTMGGKAGGKSRSRILAALDANGCRGGDIEIVQRRPQEEVGEVRKRPGLLASLFGVNPALEDESEPPRDRRELVVREPEKLVRLDDTNIRRVNRAAEKPNKTAAGAAAVGAYATMCVRTCDGYFFPMSPSSSAQDFDRDQKNCQSACPGAEMQVFYRESKAGEDGVMTSVATGRPYSELPTAYRYKEGPEARPATCGCNVAKNFSVIAGNPPKPEPATVATSPSDAAAPASTPARPASAPEQAETAAQPAPQPETIAAVPQQSSPSIITIVPAPTPAPAAIAAAPGNKTPGASDHAARAEAPPAAEPVEREFDADDRKVRVVGPVFLPDPAEAIDLRAPARTQVQ